MHQLFLIGRIGYVNANKNRCECQAQRQLLLNNYGEQCKYKASHINNQV